MERCTDKRRVASVGTYDGLHRGHRRVISHMLEIAARRGLEPLVVTFDRHPRQVVSPAGAPPLLMHPAERDRLLREWGLPSLTLTFDRLLASLTAEEWLRRMHDDHGVDVLVLGHDNRFGSDGRGMNLEAYRTLGERLGVEIVEAPVEEGVSSTLIRRMVREGEVEEAAGLLGHPFTLLGTVVPGKRMGSGIGFPTANVEPFEGAIVPKGGVYAVIAEWRGRRRPGVCNIGHQPTVAADAPLRIEVHIPGEDSGLDLYGETLRVSFMARLRDEMRFGSVDELKAQIRRDIEMAEGIAPEACEQIKQT